MMHENQNQETPSKLYAVKKKSEQQESHVELLPFILCVWNITVSVKKKKKKSCHKAICCAVSLKGPDIQTGSIMKFIGNISVRAHTGKKHLSNSIDSCLPKENSANRTAGLGEGGK